MRLLSIAFSLIPVFALAKMVAWYPLDGSSADKLGGPTGNIQGGAEFRRMDGRIGVDFDGKSGVVFVKDSAPVAFSGSFSIGAEVWVRDNPRGGSSPGGQIVFRGDDRCACDNYSLNLGSDGFYTFMFDSPDGQRAVLRARARLGKWERLLATFNHSNGQMQLIIDGNIVAEQWVPQLPITAMIHSDSPGLSLGNVQNPAGGRHWQPFNGLIRDVRLFDEAVMWDDAWNLPIRTLLPLD